MNIDCLCVYFRKAECTHYKRPEKECWFLINGKCNLKRQTNADRIRAMSDEELMLFLLNELSDETLCSHCVPIKRIENKCDGHCKNGILEWLKRPAEVNYAEIY